jgi:PTS system mannitol-specific IIA component
MAEASQTASPELLELQAVRLDQQATDRDSAIRQCGEFLVELGAVDPSYIEAMLLRERSISTYVGEGVAIPHGTLAGKKSVRRDALAVLRFTEPVNWDGKKVSLCVAIAAIGDGHTEILTELAQVLLDPERARMLRETADPAVVVQTLRPMHKP